MNPLKAIVNLPGKIMRGTARKVWGSTTGAAFGPPLARVLMYYIDVDEEIAPDVNTLIEMGVTLLSAYVAGYMTPERKAR